MQRMLWVFSLMALSSSTQAAPIELPAWAYPMNSVDSKPGLEDGGVRHVPGSAVTFALSQTRNLYFSPDWHPEDHPPMPTVVAQGHAPEVYACGFCHRATGSGGPENANLSGLPFDYLVQQLRDFRAGTRTTALPQRLPQKLMIALAKKLSDADINEAAAYFSTIKPRPNVRVIETDTVPAVVVASWKWVDPKTGTTEPIGRRIVEVPEYLEAFELRDARTTFIAYVPPGSLRRGEALVTGKVPTRVVACASCHGVDLKGMTIAPPIAGRSASYAMRQLSEFKMGLRRNANAALMTATLDKLDADDLRDIVAYLTSLPP